MALIDAVAPVVSPELEAIADRVRVIGHDEAGPLIETLPQSPIAAYQLAMRLTRTNAWHVLGAQREDAGVTIVLGCAPSPIQLCKPCKGLGYRPDFLHVCEGRCFTCRGSGHRR